jgi:hypothetical protein
MCRTPELGAAIYRCECGETILVNHSCRNRHCPICQGAKNAEWAEKQMASSLPVKYYHIVFTLPDIINPFIHNNKKTCYNALFNAASSAILKLCDDPKYLGATPGFTAVLHTWGQTMQFHPHLHVIMTAGGLTKNGLHFIDKSGSDFLFPVKKLSRLFRGIFLDELTKTASIPYCLKSSLYQTDFFCYLKEPLERSDNVVMYLARYANRICITDRRIIKYDKVNNTVTFSYKDNKDGGKEKNMTLSAVEFMHRFFFHVLPEGFMKIRHFGILQNKGKFLKIKLCRRLLNVAEEVHTSRYWILFQKIKCNNCGKPLFISGHFNALELRRLNMVC